MPMSLIQQQYYSFLEEYTSFLEGMLGNEQNKLQALMSKDLARIENSITASQANAKQLENYETKRCKMQIEAGYEGKTFRQVIEAYPQEVQCSFWRLFDRFERSVGGIRFHNDKSMAVAKDNMMAIDPSAVLPGAASKTAASNPYSKMKQAQDGLSSILQTKI